MKSYQFFVIAALFLFSSITSNAQSSVGFKGGIYISNSWFSSLPMETQQKELLGVQIGTVINLDLGDHFSIQTEFLYIEKGYDLESKGTISSGLTFQSKVQSRISYLEIPLMARLTYNLNLGRQIYLVGGPSVGYALFGKDKSNFTFNGESFASTMDIDFETRQLERVDYGVAFGGGFIFKAGLKRMGIDLRFSLGLTDIFKSTEGGIIFNNKGMGLSLVYFLY